MDCDIALGALPIVALVQAAKRDARLVQRLHPGLALKSGEIARAEIQQAVKIALRDDHASVHVELAKRQRRVEHQPLLRGAIEKFYADQRARAIAENLYRPRPPSAPPNDPYEPVSANRP